MVISSSIGKIVRFHILYLTNHNRIVDCIISLFRDAVNDNEKFDGKNNAIVQRVDIYTPSFN